MEYHAKLSPSGAHRWMPCPGSVVLSEGVEDKGSAYAAEGTAAHQIATYCLQDGTDAHEYVGEAVRVGEYRIPVTSTMAQHVQKYVDYVREAAVGGTLIVEKDVPIGHLTGEEGATGRADAIIIFAARRHVKTIDLKYGMGEVVYATENPQPMQYTLGAIEEYGIATDFATAEMVIHMPRLDFVDRWSCDVARLNAFAAEVGLAAKEVEEARNSRDTLPESTWNATYLNPGEKQCRWCVAKPCKALADTVLDLAAGPLATAADFAALVPPALDEAVGDNWLAQAMGKVGLIEDFCKSLRAEIERRLFAGKDVPGYKLVEGKLGNRKWTSVDEAEKLLKSFKLKHEEMYDRTVISPTSAEKLLKTASPARWKKAQAIIDRAPGKPSVAPEGDKRPAIKPNIATAADFADLL